jgi:hypothetical protein
MLNSATNDWHIAKHISHKKDLQPRQSHHKVLQILSGIATTNMLPCFDEEKHNKGDIEADRR